MWVRERKKNRMDSFDFNRNDGRPGGGGNNPRPPQWNPRPQPPRPQPPRPRPPRPLPIDDIIIARNAVITDIDILPAGSFVTIFYEVFDPFNRPISQTVRLVITRDTEILNQLRQPIPVWGLRVGMRVNARFSSAMTMSIPPQSVATFIRILSFR